MQTKLSTSLDFFTPDESFSLGKLVLRLKNLFESHAYCSVHHAFPASLLVACLEGIQFPQLEKGDILRQSHNFP